MQPGGRSNFPPGLISERVSRCEDPTCNTRPLYGLPGGKATHCTKHKTDAMKDLLTRKYVVVGSLKMKVGKWRGKLRFFRLRGFCAGAPILTVTSWPSSTFPPARPASSARLIRRRGCRTSATGCKSRLVTWVPSCQPPISDPHRVCLCLRDGGNPSQRPSAGPLSLFELLTLAFLSRCGVNGCPTVACYNETGKRTGIRCVNHAEPGMVDVRNQT